MDLYKALYAFYNSLVSKDCEHVRVQIGSQASYCPDCGYKIRLLWTMVKCRECDSRRIPRRMPDGAVEPLHRYCRHCGTSAYRVVKKESIDAYELLYALSVKEVDYTEERRSPEREPMRYTAPTASTPEIVEGQVLRKRYVNQNTTSAWSESPFSFQKSNRSVTRTNRQLH